MPQSWSGDQVLAEAIARSLKTESIVHVRGETDGVQFLLIVAAGVNAGLVEQAVFQGDGLKLTNKKLDTFSGE